MGKPIPLLTLMTNGKPLGNDLLSQGAASQVPSALAGLTAGFGMGPGVPPPLESPRGFHTIEWWMIN